MGFLSPMFDKVLQSWDACVMVDSILDKLVGLVLDPCLIQVIRQILRFGSQNICMYTLQIALETGWLITASHWLCVDSR